MASLEMERDGSAEGGAPCVEGPDCAGAGRGDPDAPLASAVDARLRNASQHPYLSERPAPKLRRLSDGTQQYEGHVFVATIAADGSVSFEDRTKAMTFDLTDAVRKYVLHEELYGAEKRWFMEETRALRERLAEAHREESLVRAARRLRARMSTLASESDDPAELRRALFELWLECAADEVGRRGRRIVEEFVRNRLPAGSDAAYSVPELEALSRGMSPGNAFAPYRD